MTKCANCGTTEGPFVRDRDNPNLPVCGYPPRQAQEGNRVLRMETEGNGKQFPVTARMDRTRACLARRGELDRHRYDHKGIHTPSCSLCRREARAA